MARALLVVLPAVASAWQNIVNLPASSDRVTGSAAARRFLLLHGSGTTAEAFVNSPTAAGAKDFILGLPPRRRDPNPWCYTALDAGSADGTWYDDQNGLKGLEEAVQVVEDAIEAEQMAGIVGHEQGGLVAALVAARASLGVGPRCLQFAVISGAAMPDNESHWAELLTALRDAQEAPSVRTLHCLSQSNPVTSPELGAKLADCFGSSAEILWHDRGKAMPGRSWWKETKGFPDRAVGRKEYVAGMYG